ncbi:MAG TPA: TIGR04255 family protein [Rhizomicrobium sp.]
MKPRSIHLPDYKRPPLNEVVLGVQFEQPHRYQQIRAGEVWALYRTEYPNVEEQPPLPPAFETFGGRPSTMFQFGIMTGAGHNRFWFLSPTKDELLQFQADRLLHNWRKVEDGSNPYPRFESMIEKFQTELGSLEAYFGSLAPQKLNINQCEVSYINHIVLDGSSDPSNWLKFLIYSDAYRPDEIAMSLRKALLNDEGKPWGRLSIDVGSGATPKGEPMMQVTLTVRGAPQGAGIVDAIKFLNDGREIIVKTFAEIMTDAAQQKWERVQ